MRSLSALVNTNKLDNVEFNKKHSNEKNLDWSLLEKKNPCKQNNKPPSTDTNDKIQFPSSKFVFQ